MLRDCKWMIHVGCQTPASVDAMNLGEYTYFDHKSCSIFFHQPSTLRHLSKNNDFLYKSVGANLDLRRSGANRPGLVCVSFKAKHHSSEASAIACRFFATTVTQPDLGCFTKTCSIFEFFRWAKKQTSYDTYITWGEIIPRSKVKFHPS